MSSSWPRPARRVGAWLIGLTLILVIGLVLGVSVALAAEGTLVDSGFESGTDGATLATPPWTASGTPQHREYDDARAKVGTKSAWIQGAAAGTNAGVWESVTGGMTSNGAELRAWVYLDTTTHSRLLEDYAAGVAVGDRATSIQFAPDGTIKVLTDRAGNPNGYGTGAYTTVGTYGVGWTQVRLVFDFATQTYTLSTRTTDGAAWTQLTASGATGYGIPFRGTNAIAQTHGTLWRGLGAGQLWLDELCYSDSGITDGPDTATPTAPAALSAADHPADQGGAIDLTWAAATDNVGVTGYKLYRGTSPGVYGPPTNLPVSTTYTDATAVTGTRYYYAVSAVDAAANEGPKSPEASAIAADNVPPVAPTGLAATGGTAEVALSWAANSESDLLGYNVYRDGGKINAVPVVGTAYTDFGLANGTYSYRVSAVDTNGNEGPQCSPVLGSPAGTPPPADGNLVDDGFESGADGATLATPPWTASGVPQRREYDNARAKAGTKSAWIQGAAAGSNAGVWEAVTGGMTSNGAELRAWVYLDTTTHSRLLEDYAAGVAVADRATSIQFAPDGTIKVLTDRAGNPNGYATAAYTTVGTYATGWTQLRLVFDFASQTYTLSSRTVDGGAWTQLKASAATGYAIPFRGTNAITQTHGTLWRGLGAGQLWLDELRYANGGIAEGDTTPPTAPAGLTAVDHPGDAGGAIDLTWTASTDNVGVTAYKLYRGTSPGVYGLPVTLPVSTSYTDPTVITGTRYYYAVTAVDDVGNESARSPEANAVAVDNAPPIKVGSLVDAGFESGADGATLATPPWTASGVPQHREYDNARAKVGAQSAWIQGAAAGSNAGVWESVTGGMTSNGAEIRAWVYFDTTTHSRLLEDYAAGVAVADRATSIQFAPDGTIKVYTDRAGNPNGYLTGAYTTVGTYGVGWTQLRLVFDFSTRTYTMSTRSDEGAAWTQLKAAAASGYAIPFRGTNAIAQTHGTLWRGLGAGQLWLDELRYADDGMTDPPPPADMPIVEDCGACHDAHGNGDDCFECHDFADEHPGTASSIHINADVSSCEPCHKASLTLEHVNRTPAGGGPFTCLTCHQSTDPLVTTAIANRVSACSACHPDAGDHATAHTFTSGSDAAPSGDAGCTNSGAGCHGTDPTRATFTVYHPNTGCTTGACHTSPSKPGYAGNGDCQTCHDGSFTNAATRTPLATAHYNETTHTASALDTTVSAGGTASAACSDCHDPSGSPGGLAAQHSNVSVVPGSPYGTTVACVECHNDVRAGGGAAVLSGWTSRACSACHSVSSSAPQHGATVPVVDTTSAQGCGDSGTGCHSSYDVHALHKNAAGGCDLSGCHDFSAQGAKPELKACGEAGGCHVTEGVDYHTHQAQSHTSVSSGCFATACHATTRNLSDVHALYVGTGRQYSQYASACDLCHQNTDPGRIDWASATPDCITCHAAYHGVPAGQPTTHKDRGAAHTPTSASTFCTDCHGDVLVDIHGATNYAPTDCRACHWGHNSITTGCELCHGSPTNFSKTADCASCHDVEAVHAGSGNDATHTASPFTAAYQGTGEDGTLPAEGKECASCHTATLGTAHGTVSTSGGSVTCAECHTDTTLGSASVVASGWPDTRCTACHDKGAATAHDAYGTAHVVSTTRGCAGSGSSCHDYTDLAKLHDKSQSGGAPTHQSCANTGCHTTVDARPAAIAADSCGQGSAGGCHDDKTTGNHGYDVSQHTGEFGTGAMAGTWTMALYPTRVVAGVLVNPPYAYSFGCATCHDAELGAEHAKPSSAPVNGSVCLDCHPTPRDSILGAWDKSCATAGCHTVAGQEQHPTTATLAPHAVAASVTAEGAGGCSASPGSAEQGNQRTPCHTTDLIQEHNRKIGGFSPFPAQTIVRTIAVSCEQCHSSAAYLALEGAWDGTCQGCHPASHAVAGSARYNEVHAMHQAPRYYDSGAYSRTGTRKAGSNAMDAHGPVRTDASISTSVIPYGCANSNCHLYFYLEAGLSSYYPAGGCETCHGANIAPLEPYQGSYMWKSGAGTDGTAFTTALTLSVDETLPPDSSLDFKTYFDIEDGWDYGYVEVSTDGGATWTSLASDITTDTDPNGQNLGNGITGASYGWIDGHFDLSAYANETVKLRLRYVTDTAVFGEGWFVDLVSVGPSGAPVFTDDVETLKPQWTVTSSGGAGWTR